MGKDKIDVRIIMPKKTEVAKKFLYVKKRLGFTTNKSVLVHLINDSYERLNTQKEVRNRKQKRGQSLE